MNGIRACAMAIFLVSPAQAADLPESASDATTQMAVAVEGQSYAGMKIFAACKRAIAEWAEPFAPVDIETIPTGPVKRRFDGKRIRPLYVRIVYDTQGGRETRKANVECTIDSADEVAVQPTP